MAEGDHGATSHLLPLVYDEIRRLAARKLAHEAPGQTLQATALVHEAYLRLVASPGSKASAGREASPGRESGEPGPHWNSRGHFYIAARILPELTCAHGWTKNGIAGIRMQRANPMVK
jgi:hypothetical protein